MLRNPLDLRTTKICINLDGKILDVGHSYYRLIEILKTTHTDHIREKDPWIDRKNTEFIKSIPKLQPDDKGYDLCRTPPFHGFCRTIIVSYTKDRRYQQEKLVKPKEIELEDPNFKEHYEKAKELLPDEIADTEKHDEALEREYPGYQKAKETVLTLAERRRNEKGNEVEFGAYTSGDGQANMFPVVAEGKEGSVGMTKEQEQFLVPKDSLRREDRPSVTFHHNHPDSLTNPVSFGDLRAIMVKQKMGINYKALFAHQLNGNTTGIKVDGDLVDKSIPQVKETLIGFRAYNHAKIQKFYNEEAQDWIDEGREIPKESAEVTRLRWIAQQHSLGDLLRTKSYAFGPQMLNTMRKYPELYLKFKRMSDESIPKVRREAEWVTFKKDIAVGIQNSLQAINSFYEATQPFKEAPTYQGQEMEEWFPNAFAEDEPERGFDSDDSDMMGDAFGRKGYNYDAMGGSF